MKEVSDRGWFVWAAVPALVLGLTVVGRFGVTEPHTMPPSLLAAAPVHSESVLRVCADPNNLPYSNRAGEGLDNKLAELVAGELGKTVEYAWWPQRRGWVRNTLNAEKCDVALEVPAGYGMVLTTRPFYSSTYVFVSRTDRHYDLHSLDDPRLRNLKIGLHFIGDDYSNPPPAHALGARGITSNITGYSIYGTYTDPNPPARLIEAVANGDVDVAIVWGPLAGYFATRESAPLTVSTVMPLVDVLTGTRFSFPMAMGVRKGDTALRDTLQRVIDVRHDDINKLLRDFGVPLVPLVHTNSAGASR